MADILRLDLSSVGPNAGEYDLDYQDEDENEEVVEEIDPLSDEFSPEDSLPPLRRILNYYRSDSTDNRQLCVRLFPEALQTMSTMTELNMLLQVVFTLAKDHNHLVRLGLLSNLPGLVEKNKDFSLGEEEIALENNQQLLDVLVRMLTDPEIEVRRVGQNVVVLWLSGECDVEQKNDMLEKLFPVIKRCLGRDENYDLRMDAAMLISKMSSLVGQAIVVKYFVPLLPSLSSDTMFHVRKAFAISCRELCPVLDEELSEQYILPLYLNLCKDEVWGVRKACADVFTDVSLACNLGTRYDRLTPAFLKLLHDDSRWVRKAAYQSLGAFISTFYIPNGNNSQEEEEGEGEGGSQQEQDSSLSLLSDSLLQDNSLLDSNTHAGIFTLDSSADNRHPSPNEGVISNSSTPIHPNGNNSVSGFDKLVQDPNFSNFEFWRSPIPSVPGSDLGEVEGERSKVDSESGTRGEEVEVTRKLDFDGVPDDQPDVATPTRPEGSRCEPGGQCGGGGGEGCGQHGQEHQSLSSATDGSKVTVNGESRNPLPDSSEKVRDPLPDGGVKVQNTPGTTAVVESNQSSSGDSSPAKKNSPDRSNPSTGGSPKVIDRLRSASASSGGRRVSVESGLRPPQHERVLNEKKRRRWSLNAPNHLNNMPQVRVFIHSTSGLVTEQDTSVTLPDDHTPSNDHAPSDNHTTTGANAAPDSTMIATETPPQGEEPIEPSLSTTTRSEAMEMTCETTVKYDEEPYVEQEIVPDELMEIYLSMTEHSRVQTVDTDLLYYCAYSLPGVTLTLGKTHWELLKPTFDYLAEDLQWKIRRVLAFSLHELARVLGTEITCQDILPIFEEYCTKDVDDVKIGTLTHLAEFLELLPTHFREKCLPHMLDGLLQMENQKNWRYRNTLVEQLLQLSDLFEPTYLQEHIYPLALQLSADKVAQVRSSANFLIGALLQRISGGDMDKCHTLLQKLRSLLVAHTSWLQRLMYVKQCETFLLNKHISQETFARECLPSVLQLARDKVPNVRIAIAKLLKDHIMSCEYFQSDNGSFSLEELQITLECLQHDADRDVKFFAGGEVVETPRLVMFPPRQWYQRPRSESHTSSDMEQYQDAAEYLNLDMGSLSLNHASPLIVSSSAPVSTSNTAHSSSILPSSANDIAAAEAVINSAVDAIAGDIEGSCDQEDRSCDQEERSHDQKERSCDQGERSCDQGERSGGTSEQPEQQVEAAAESPHEEGGADSGGSKEEDNTNTEG